VLAGCSGHWSTGLWYGNCRGQKRTTIQGRHTLVEGLKLAGIWNEDDWKEIELEVEHTWVT
jgi:hypothetical protein